MPALKRGFISFHHLCGYDDSSTPANPTNCTIALKKDPHQEEVYVTSPERKNRSLAYEVPESKLLNNGSLSRITNWFFEYQQLPIVNRHEKIVLEAEFDSENGGFGADNIHFHTPQR